MNQEQDKKDQAEKKRVEDITRRIDFIANGLIIGVVIGAVYWIFQIISY